MTLNPDLAISAKPSKAKTAKEDLIVPASVNSTADAAVNAARVAQSNVNSYLDIYVTATGRVLDAAQRAYIAWLETAFRLPMFSLNVMRYTLDEATRVESTGVVRPNSVTNVARYALDETVEIQREARKLIDEVSESVKTTQDATVSMAQANFRLAQAGITYRNGTSAS